MAFISQRSPFILKWPNPEVPPAGGTAWVWVTSTREAEMRAGSAILGKPEYSTLPRLDIPAANTPSRYHSQSSRAQEHIEDQNNYPRKAASCFPITQTLPNFKPWPRLQVEKNAGTTGLLRWTHSAPWYLANSNNQQHQWRKMWINFLTTSSYGNPNNFKSEHQWRRNQTGLK